jgi:4-amino-4-deoxy-L-arabinose transferase-like glycosyltransferase
MALGCTRVVIDGRAALAYDPMPDSVSPGWFEICPRPESEWPSMSVPKPRLDPISWTVARVRECRNSRLKAPALWRILELALFARLVAAVAVEWYVRRRGTPRVCVFDDAEYYWALAGTIRQGTLYEVVEWGDIPHFAVRVPGYPVFLAACQTILGERPLAARLVQAGLGVLTVWLMYQLSREITGKNENPAMTTVGPITGRADSRPWTVPLVAALLAAVHPHFVVMSVLILSEAVFFPLMLAALWGMAAVWNETAAPPGAVNRRALVIALGVGAASGAAILVRPSWALFVPVMLVAWLWSVAVSRGFPPRLRILNAAGVAAVVLLGLCIVMSPWWIRNVQVFGRFVPTAVWMGASLSDGLNPHATGASDMKFLESPDIWPLDELDQDRELTRRALVFVQDEPGRALELALFKLARYWSPWPNAEGFRSPLLAVVSTLVVVPLLALAGLGLWGRWRDPRAWVLLAGPLFYFCFVHLVFASSMRYRIPGELPAMGLAAIGVMTIARKVAFRRISS